LTTDGPGGATRGVSDDATADRPDRHGAAPGASAAPEPSWMASLQGLVHELPGLVSDRIELLALELQRAGQALAQIVALIVAAAILAVTAWLALWAGVLVALVSAGLHWAAAALLLLVVNLGACAWAVARVRTLAPLLQLPATRRHLTVRRAATSAPGPSADEASAHDTPAAAARAH
jgi:uncharacterized membrane protein YqjE